MDSLESKKLALLRILQILYAYSDSEHRLIYDEILTLLRRDYGLTVERKAVGRNLSLLREAGFEIVTTPRGSYLAERPFEDAELRLLIDGVLSSAHISPSQSEELIGKLCKLSNRYFLRQVKNICSVREWNKTENQAVFLHIEMIGEAIAKGRKVRFAYNKYGADKRLHRTGTHVVSPYQMILRNQRYYLMAYAESWGEMSYFRLDRITEMEQTDEAAVPLRSIRGYESGIDYRRISSSMPYMFSDAPVPVEFTAKGEVLDQVIDWFGKEISVSPQGEQYLVRVRVSPRAMVYWAMQYADAVEGLSPVSLREEIAKTLLSASERYKRHRSRSYEG